MAIGVEFLVGQLRGPIGCKLKHGQFQPTKSVTVDLGCHVGKHLARRGGVSPNTMEAVLADLQSGCGEFEQALEKTANEILCPGDFQELVEFLVGFPVVPVVEQVQCQQKTAIVGPVLIEEWLGRRARLLVAVPFGVPIRMRSRGSGNESVGGQCDWWQKTRGVLECFGHW